MWRLLAILFVPFGIIAQDVPVELRIQAGHQNKVTVVQCSQDGKFLASGSYDQSIILWEVATGRELRKFQSQGFPIAVDFSPNTKLLISTTDKGIAQIWELQTGKLLKEIGGKDLFLKTAKFLPGGKRFVTTGGGETALLWSLSESVPVGIFEGERPGCYTDCQRTMDISTDGTLMLTADNKGIITLWDVNQLQPLHTYKHYPENRHSSSSPLLTAFLPGDKQFVVASEDEGILKWSVEDNRNPEVLKKPRMVTSGLKFMLRDMAINQKGNKLAILFLEGVQGSFQRENNEGLHIFDLETSQKIKSFDIGDFDRFLSLDFYSNSDTLVWANGAIPQLIDIDSARSFKEFRGHLTRHIAPYWIMQTTQKHLLVPGKRSIIERVGNHVYGWHIDTGKVTTSYPSHEKLVLGMALSPDTLKLATGGEDYWMKVSDLATGELRWEKKTNAPVFALAFSKDGQHLFSAHLNGTVMMWDALTGDYIKYLSQGVSDWYHTPLAMDVTTRGLLAWSDHLVNVETGKTIVTFEEHGDRVHDIKISADGKSMLTTGWDGKVVLRELYYGGQVITMEHHGKVYAAAWNPDMSQIATGGADNTLRLWSAEGTHVLDLEGHSAPVVSLTYTEDGQSLISGSMDGTVKVWDPKSGKEQYTHVLLDRKRWTLKIPSGHFYATSDVRREIFFVKGMQSFKLDQFFEEFYQPGLLLDLLGSREKVRSDLGKTINKLPPPKVEIAFPNSGMTDKESVEIFLKLTNAGGGIDEIKVMQNGKRVIEDMVLKKLKPDSGLLRSYRLRLVPGVNLIEASAFSKGRLESATASITLTRPADEPTANCYILAIGINQYKNPRLNLNYAVADAKGIAGLISEESKKLFAKIETHLILDEQATRQNIIRNLEALAEKVKPTDVFYFFYAGHGSLVDQKFYFIPMNSVRLYEEESLEATAIDAEELVEYFKNIRALKQVIIMDACHSGGSTALLATRGAGEEKALAQLSRSAGVHVLAAAGSEQTATEYNDLGHGLFTYLIIEALEGKADGAPRDDKITVYELKAFLDDQVPEHSLRFRNRPQYPNTFSLGHDFPIILK